MKINGNAVKPGMIVEHKGELWVVNKSQSVKPGKGGAFNQVEMKNIKTSTKLNERFRASEEVERVRVDEEKYQYLYKQDNKLFFMNSTSYEQIEIDEEIVGEKLVLMSENDEFEHQITHIYKDIKACNSIKIYIIIRILCNLRRHISIIFIFRNCSKINYLAC